MDTLVAASADMKIGGIITNLDKTSIRCAVVMLILYNVLL